MTRKLPKCSFAVNGLLDKLEPRLKNQKFIMVSRIRPDAFLTTTDHYFWSKSKFHFWSLEVIGLGCPGGISWPQWPHFDTLACQMNVKFEISASNYPRGAKTRKMSYDVTKGHWPRLTSVDLGKVTTSVQTMDTTSQHLFMCKYLAKMPKFACYRR